MLRAIRVWRKTTSPSWFGGMMSSSDDRVLADSMIRLYGKSKAFTLASRYAADCTANNDDKGHSKWAAAAAKIAELIELEEQLGKKSQK
jgi:hypothetical protein